MRIVSALFATVMVSSLAACGGGDPSTPSAANPNPNPNPTPSDVADKYAGTWVACTPSGGDSFRSVLVATKIGATQTSYTLTIATHVGNTTCAGTGGANYNETGTVSYQGTKVVGSNTVDMGLGTVTSNNDPSDLEPRQEKDISLVSGSSMNFGDTDLALDAQGYPNFLDLSVTFVKQ